jgi:hypothetical protein
MKYLKNLNRCFGKITKTWVKLIKLINRGALYKDKDRAELRRLATELIEHAHAGRKLPAPSYLNELKRKADIALNHHARSGELLVKACSTPITGGTPRGDILMESYLEAEAAKAADYETALEAKKIE